MATMVAVRSRFDYVEWMTRDICRTNRTYRIIMRL